MRKNKCRDVGEDRSEGRYRRAEIREELGGVSKG